MNDVQLVVGGAGFLGSMLSRLLLKRGPVRVFDDLSTGSCTNLNDLDLDLVVGSVLEPQALREAMADVNVVYHLACRGVRHSLAAPYDNHRVNAEGTLQVLQAALAANVEHFVYTSSSEVYGTAMRVPMDEDHPTRPHTVYGASKLAGEAYTRAYWYTHGLSTVIVRPFNSFGPRSHHEGDSGEVIPKFLVRHMNEIQPIIFGDGTQTRDFTYVEDTARGLVAAGDARAAIGETINLGSGQEVSMRELAAHVAQITGAQDLEPCLQDARPGDVLRLVADTQKAEELLGWRSTVTLKEGLAKLLRWHDEQGTDWATALLEDRARNWELSED